MKIVVEFENELKDNNKILKIYIILNTFYIWLSLDDGSRIDNNIEMLFAVISN